LITRRIWRHLFREEVEIRKPSTTAAIRLRNAEWGRTPKHSLKDQADYWEKYLLGQGHLEVGFDVMAETEEHQQFMREQIERLAIRPGENVADFGGGTGLFHQSLLGLDQTRQLFQEAEPNRPNICSVDVVEAALEKSKARVSRLAAQHGVAEASFSFQLASLEVSRFKPIWRFLNGHYFSVEKLKGKIEGLSDYSIDLWHADYSEFLHAVLRGKQLDVTDVHRINKEFALGETEILLDMNLAARFVRRRLEARDFRDPHTFKALLGADVLDYSKVNARHLNFKKLNFRSSSLNLNLDFQTGQFDKMLCSTVLSYLFNPLESLLEFKRILKPGGRLVISTFRPDVDMSRIYTRLIQKIESDPFYLAPNEMAREDFLNAVRAFANSAAFLLQLEEEGSFKFFSREELRSLLEEAGFKVLCFRLLWQATSSVRCRLHEIIERWPETTNHGSTKVEGRYANRVSKSHMSTSSCILRPSTFAFVLTLQVLSFKGWFDNPVGFRKITCLTPCLTGGLRETGQLKHQLPGLPTRLLPPTAPGAAASFGANGASHPGQYGADHRDPAGGDFPRLLWQEGPRFSQYQVSRRR
jgi:ubiquinone/menaquinone biosynthesis C-methylase UbiE